MLDLDHPLTPHVFAASAQLDMILGTIKRISIADSKGRLFTLETVRPCFAALRWLQAQRFTSEAEIVDAINELEQRMEDLAKLGGGRAQWLPDEIPPKKCPVCKKTLTTYGVYEPRPGLKVPAERYCSPCMETAMPALQRVREAFGTDAI